MMTKSKLSAFFVTFAMTFSMSAFLAMADDPVNYLDENGEAQICDEDYTFVTSDDTEWETGWYVVDGTVTLSSRVTVDGEVDLILMDGCTLNAKSGGIDVSEGNSLTIYVQSMDDEMGILNATGTNGGAGIGGGKSSGAGTITINGGTITATGAGSAAGIGSGYLASENGAIQEGDGGTIIINDGDITATGGLGSAGIGGGRNAASGTIEINGGTIEATGKGDSMNSGSAGIGSGSAYDIYYGGASYSAEKGSITITGGTVTATGTLGAAGIGSGMYYPLCPDITIDGGTITAKGRSGAAGIGSGVYAKQIDYTITITDGDITTSNTQSASSTSKFGGAGIGSGADCIGNCEVIISGGTISAKGGNYAPGVGIGSGNNHVGNCDGTITISGGDIYSYGEAAIGNGYDQSGDLTLNISDGYFKMLKAASDANYMGAGPEATGTVDVSITGGYYVIGDTDSDTVYETSVADGYIVVLNEEDTKGTWPYKVEQKTFILTVTAPEFEDVVYGYEQPEAKNIIISNVGNSDVSIGNVTIINMSDNGEDAFILSGKENKISAGESIDTWTIQPVEGLDVGKYTVFLTFSYHDAKDMYYNQETDVKANVSITVLEPETYTLSITMPEFETITYGDDQPEAQSIVISNTGNSDVTIDSITIDNEDAFILSGSDYVVTSGESLDTWTIQPVDGLEAGEYTVILTISYNDTETIAELSFTVSEEEEEDEEDEVSITVTTEKGGEIILVKADLSSGGYAIYNISPDEGYEIDTVLLDGVDVTSEVLDNQYILTDIQGSHTLSVTFKLVNTESLASDSDAETDIEETDIEETDQTTTDSETTTSTRSSRSNSSNGGGSSSSHSTNTSSGSWVKDENGWKYVYSDGSYESGKMIETDGEFKEQVSWKQINGKWWAFGSNGYLSTGWVLDRDKGLWYYVDETNGMLTGWHYDTQDGYWYYLDTTNGHMLTGWQLINEKWYYFNPQPECQTWFFDDSLNKWMYDESTIHRPLGSMYANEETPDGYLMGEDGSLKDENS